MHKLYVLQSIKTGRKYTGTTRDLSQRLKEHNSGSVRSTRKYRPYKIIYAKLYETKTEAIKRERFLKTGRGREELKSLVERLGR